MDFFTLLSLFAKNYNHDILTEFKENPLVQKTWIKVFKGISLEDLEQALINAIATFPKKNFPSPGQVYDAYFKPILKVKATKEWQAIISACGDRLKEQEVLFSLSDPGNYALKSVDGIVALRDKQDSYTRNAFINNWLDYHQQLREGIIEPMPKALPPSKPVVYEDKPLSPEEKEQHLKMMNRISQMFSKTPSELEF